jgi:sulfide:quinone oxidoreductase
VNPPASSTASDRRRVLIAGGGIAGLEALIALRDLAGDRVDLTLVAPDPEFTYRPMIVEEPFSLTPAERRDLAAVAQQFDARFVLGGLSEIRTTEHRAFLADGTSIEYDAAMICVGARSRPAYRSATTLRSWAEPIAIDDAIDQAASHSSRRLVFAVPPRIVWSLPLYELAMLSQRRAVDRGLEVDVEIVTPELRPLELFGSVASKAVADLLKARGIRVMAGSSLVEEDGTFFTVPGREELVAGAVVALPALSGPRIAGLPSDSNGFIPTDEHGEILGVSDVFAAGDGIAFPVKQGGLGTQQADAAAEMIAARAGAPVDPQPFRPVLRGKLITGAESLNLRSQSAGGGGEGTASMDYLWWPPTKVGGKYLAPYLAGTSHFEPDPPAHSLDVEVSLPVEWHSEPMALDPQR